ncbi:MAG: NUDIX domain-containing protein [Bacteroides sp.]
MEHPLSSFSHCPKCGSNLFSVHNEKSKQCDCCGFVYYFNPSAATVALIMNTQNELLVCRRAKDPAKGTLDLPGGFIDLNETAEEGVAREVLEETGVKIENSSYLFSLPNLYVYSGFTVHTLDLFFRCTIADTDHLEANDDVAEAFFVPLNQIKTDDFGLSSIRKGLKRFCLTAATERTPQQVKTSKTKG